MLVERKSQILNSPIFETVKQIKYCQSHKDDFIDMSTGEVKMTYETSLGLLEFLKYDSDFNDSMKIIHADNRRYNRLFQRIIYFMNFGTCLFLTLTFKDDVLESTNEDSRRRYVRRFLKEYSNCFIANIDYGSKTDREHYHAFILYPDVKIVENWKYGFSNAQIIRDNPKDCERVTRYILKIANHFVKSTVKRNYAIYSRWSDDWKLPEYPEKVIIPEDEQLCFWEHLPHLNDSNFDRSDYLD